MKKLSIKFNVLVNDEEELTNYEYFLEDLLKSSVLPALSSTIVPLTLSVTKSRN
jgi:hypothetical protein